VPDLLAKPIIDVLVVIADRRERSGLPAVPGGGRLPAAGPRARAPAAAHPDLGVHFHLWSDGAPAVETHLAFLDQLRASSQDRDRYAAAKRELATRDWPTMNHYADAKTDVIRQVLNRAALTLVPAHWIRAASRSLTGHGLLRAPVEDWFERP
jgi:GrpB-like predicted nucleotidyltransferase (UPF0157 family)